MISILGNSGSQVPKSGSPPRGRRPVRGDPGPGAPLVVQIQAVTDRVGLEQIAMFPRQAPNPPSKEGGADVIPPRFRFLSSAEGLGCQPIPSIVNGKPGTVVHFAYPCTSQSFWVLGMVVSPQNSCLRRVEKRLCTCVLPAPHAHDGDHNQGTAHDDPILHGQPLFVPYHPCDRKSREGGRAEDGSKSSETQPR
jgi:hypothetical protein